MKTLFTAIVVCLGTLAPLVQAQSVDAAPAAASTEFKSIGGFPTGKKFTLKVEEAIFAKASLTGSGPLKKAPAGLPNYKKGQSIKFKIGNKGELIGPGFNMKLKDSSDVSNVYTSGINKKLPTSQPNVAIVYKDSKGKAIGVALSFYKFNIKGFQTTTYTAFYSLGSVTE
ncbi:MAG: hypothetical protein V4640_09050 [Verrucomicrobiota bacterium]